MLGILPGDKDLPCTVPSNNGEKARNNEYS